MVPSPALLTASDTVATLVALLLASVLAELIVPRLLRIAIRQSHLQAPQGIPQSDWDSLTKPPNENAGRWIGRLELVIFFISFWLRSYEIAGAWLLFKVGSKWEVWTNLVRIPSELPRAEPLSYLRARYQWSSRVFERFLIGTASNLLVAALGVAAARVSAPLLAPIFP